MARTDTLKCPYCNSIFPVFAHWTTAGNKGTQNKYYFNLDASSTDNRGFGTDAYCITLSRCSSCYNDIITIEPYIPKGIAPADVENYNNDLVVNVKPRTLCERFPVYVPQNIRTDYEEACAIKHLSPKAAATLARRCLQGMIRDFWQTNEKNLFEEIKAIEDKIPAVQWKAIDALRSLGNIGAHMEKDVNCIVDIDDGEAEKLIKLIELLIEQWYINRYEQEQLFSDIVGINDEKQAERKKPR